MYINAFGDAEYLLDHLMIQPFSSMKPQGIKDTTECPVREHTDPDRNRSETKDTTKNHT